jgi:lipopolysaccharide transport protein LptA
MGWVFQVRLLAGLFLIGFVVGSVAGPAMSAEETEKAKGEKDKGGQIHISSDKVRSNQNERWVEFIGNVKATQDGGVITADSIRIFYNPDADESKGVSSTAVDRMIAQGSVKILFDNASKTAVAQKAVYTTHDKVLVLSGGEPTVWSGQNVIHGKKITVFQAEDRTLVEGDEKNQVEATFHSQGEGGLAK